MEVINLNLIPTGALPVVHASQYDEGRTFGANLMDGSTVYTLDGTEVLECDVKKPDGNIVTVAVTNTSDSFITIDTTLQMCACAGESLAELHITKGAQEIGTLNFILAVERSPLEGGIESDSGIHNLQTQIGEAVAEQYAAEDVVFDAAPTAGHGTGFAVTSEGVKTYVEGEIAGLTIPEELDDLADVEITTPTNGEILVYNNGVFENQANPASTANFAADYDDTATYNTNDKVIYQGLYYIALEDSITGAWDPTKWALTTVSALTAEELPLSGNDSTPVSTAIGSLSDLTTTNKDSLVEAVNEVNKYETDDYNVATYGGVIRCKKWGRIVNVQGFAIGSSTQCPTGAAYTFATIAEKYRPNPQQQVMGFATASSYKYDSGQGYRINTDGTVVAYVYAGTNLNNGYFNVTYIV